MDKFMLDHIRQSAKDALRQFTKTYVYVKYNESGDIVDALWDSIINSRALDNGFVIDTIYSNDKVMTLKEYIEELRKERDSYYKIFEDTDNEIADARAWLLNRIIGELTGMTDFEILNDILGNVTSLYTDETDTKIRLYDDSSETIYTFDNDTGKLIDIEKY